MRGFNGHYHFVKLDSVQVGKVVFVTEKLHNTALANQCAQIAWINPCAPGVMGICGKSLNVH